MPIVLLGNVENRKSFDLFNILIKNNFNVICSSKKSFFVRLFLSIVYCRFVVNQDLNYIFSNFKKNKFWTNTHLVIFPVDENIMEDYYNFKEEKPHQVCAAFPEKSTFYIASDKKKLMAYCRSIEVLVPDEFETFNTQTLSLVSYPLIAKPKIGAGSIGIQRIYNENELKIFLNKNQNFNEDYLIQELIGNGRDVEGGFFLCDHGKVISFYSHKRIRTYPSSGGVTVFSKIDRNHKIFLLGSKILGSLNWNGLAMVEFIFDPKDQEYKLIEINPRAWGSILLSEFSGLLMISTYVSLAVGKDTSLGGSVNIRKDNSYVRWFFPWDLITYINSRFKIQDFWKMNFHNTCYINFTYSTFWRSFFFLAFNFLSFERLVKFTSKIK